MEDALQRLDKLTQEEARMATAEILRLTQIVDNKVTTVDDKVTTVVNGEPHVINWLYILNARTLVRRQRNKASGPTNSKQRRRHKMFVFHPTLPPLITLAFSQGAK